MNYRIIRKDYFYFKLCNRTEKLISWIIAPLLVGLVLLLVDRWLDD
ncbi:type I toxin-antitoxin system Fst family toxin [Enterococcus faecalis]